MIVKMKKFTFVGPSGEKERFVRRLQDLGVTHINLPAEAVEPSQISKEIQRVSEVKKFLGRMEKKKESGSRPSDYTRICSRREELGRREADLQNKTTALKKERALLEPWGDFNPGDIAFLRSKGLYTGFYRMPTRLFEKLPLEKTYCHIARRTEGETSFVAMASEKVDLGTVEEKLPQKGLSQIDMEIGDCEKELSEISREYERLAAKIKALAEAEVNLKNDYEYRKVLLNTASELDDRVFILTCWSPVPEKEIIGDIGKRFHFGYFCEDPGPDDKVPVLLSNKPVFDSGEDLVNIYSQPNYSDFDPSGIVLYFFAVFYGMIIGDAGYGLVLLALTGLLHWKIKSTGDLWIRFRRMSYILSFSVLFWGIVSGGYFGITLGDNSILRNITFLDMSTKQGMNDAMLFSIIIGMIHISIALGIKFYRVRDIASLGWIVVIWSGYALIKSNMISGVANPGAMWILIAGMAMVVLFTSNSRNPLVRIALGFNGALGVVQLFSDILSYMRLFALGLATMYMCQTFNMLAAMPYKGLPYIGIIPAILILITGHGINIMLGVMGGVVHGLRLNFLEWYRWCFEGDGLAFKPFRKI